MTANTRSDAKAAFADSLGMNYLVHLMYAQADITDLFNELVRRATNNIEDAGALMDLSIILHTRGQAEQARQLQTQALQCQRCYRVVHGDGTGLRILALMTAGDFMANTPIDFLLNGSNAVLYLFYVDEETTQFENVPEHDVAFMAVGEAPEHGPLLNRLHMLLENWQGPLLNGNPVRIGELTRHWVSETLARESSLLSPIARLLPRDELLRSKFEFPIIIRPMGSHAGHGLEKIDTEQEKADYLGKTPGEIFYATPFIDYRGQDGRYSKQRVVLIDGRPFASHLAISDHWMVHYLNASMTESGEKRALEALWMETFDDDFAVRHAAAFKALHSRIGLDYFGFDCAEAPDGRLLIFEVDVALIVHDMDDARVFPYKKPAMQKLFKAFLNMLAEAAGKT